jgi:prepilin-type processing-associated H-X9-DG protein
MEDRGGLDLVYNFGGAHTHAFNMAFCDGSVHTISYTIEPFVHWALGGTNDGASVELSDVR